MYKKILNIGVLEKDSKNKNKQIRLLNTYALITMHFTLLMPIGDFITGILKDRILYSYLFIFFNMLFVLFLNKIGKHRIAKLQWMLIIIINIFLFSIVIMPGSYNEYYYAFLSGIALSLYKKNTIPVFFTILSFCLFFVPYYGVIVYPKQVVNKLDISAIVGLFLSFYLLVNYFKKNNIKSEKQLQSAFVELENRKKNEVAQLELKSLKNKINPHFIFNSINAIQDLVLRGDKLEAYQYLSKFSKIIRDGVNVNHKDYVKLDQEITLLQKYLELEKLRFQNMFEYHLEIASGVGDVFVPSVVLQTFIDDAMLRLFHVSTSSKQLKINLTKEKDICVKITDNGVSKESFEILKSNSGLSDKEITLDQKIKIFNQFYQAEITYTRVQKKEITETIIKLPYLAVLNI